MSTDLLNIAKSKVRRDVLALFFVSGGKKYYVRELERLLGYSAGNIRRELVRLSTGGLLSTERTGNLVMYSVNRTHPLHEEIKGIVSKTVGLEAEIRSLLYDFKDISHAFLYGSFANGNEDAGSDVDLALVGEMDEKKFVKELGKLEKNIKREINYTLYSARAFREELRKKGSFLNSVYNGRIIILKGDKIAG